MTVSVASPTRVGAAPPAPAPVIAATSRTTNANRALRRPNRDHGAGAKRTSNRPPFASARSTTSPSAMATSSTTARPPRASERRAHRRAALRRARAARGRRRTDPRSAAPRPSSPRSAHRTTTAANAARRARARAAPRLRRRAESASPDRRRRRCDPSPPTSAPGSPRRAAIRIVCASCAGSTRASCDGSTRASRAPALPVCAARGPCKIYPARAPTSGAWDLVVHGASRRATRRRGRLALDAFSTRSTRASRAPAPRACLVRRLSVRARRRRPPRALRRTRARSDRTAARATAGGCPGALTSSTAPEPQGRRAGAGARTRDRLRAALAFTFALAAFAFAGALAFAAGAFAFSGGAFAFAFTDRERADLHAVQHRARLTRARPECAARTRWRRR